MNKDICRLRNNIKCMLKDNKSIPALECVLLDIVDMIAELQPPQQLNIKVSRMTEKNLKVLAKQFMAYNEQSEYTAFEDLQEGEYYDLHCSVYGEDLDCNPHKVVSFDKEKRTGTFLNKLGKFTVNMRDGGSLEYKLHKKEDEQ